MLLAEINYGSHYIVKILVDCNGIKRLDYSRSWVVFHSLRITGAIQFGRTEMIDDIRCWETGISAEHKPWLEPSRLNVWFIQNGSMLVLTYHPYDESYVHAFGITNGDINSLVTDPIRVWKASRIDDPGTKRIRHTNEYGRRCSRSRYWQCERPLGEGVRIGWRNCRPVCPWYWEAGCTLARAFRST